MKEGRRRQMMIWWTSKMEKKVI